MTCIHKSNRSINNFEMSAPYFGVGQLAQGHHDHEADQSSGLSDRDINTIKNVVSQSHKNNNYDMCNRVANKVQDVLKISTDMYAWDFLEKILEDYNYLATRE